MDSLEFFIATLDSLLDTKRRRHLVGGILMSMSFLFGGMAMTTITIKSEEM